MLVKFSIITPFYNSSNFLKKSVLSIINQKRKDIEIILVDDNSKDKSEKEISILKKNNSYIKYLKNEKNLGVGLSRNKAIKKAKGQYVIFLDSDDQLYKNSINKIEQTIIKKNNPDIVILKHKKSTLPATNEKLIEDLKYKKKAKNLVEYLLETKVPFADCWFFCVKNKILKDNKIFFPPTHFGESEFYVLQVLFFIKNFSVNEDFVYKKNDRAEGLNSSTGLKATNSVILNLIYKFNFLKKNKSISSLKKKIFFHYINENLGLLTALLFYRSQKELYQISKFVKTSLNKVKLPNTYFKKESFFNFCKKPTKNGAELFLNFFASKKLIKINKLLNKKNNIYIYCNSRFSAALEKIINKNKYFIKGIIDDSKILKNSIYTNTNVLSFKRFLKLEKDLTSLGIIICHQKEIVSRKIKAKLINKGFKSNQILIFKF